MQVIYMYVPRNDIVSLVQPPSTKTPPQKKVYNKYDMFLFWLVGWFGLVYFVLVLVFFSEEAKPIGFWL